MIGFLSSLLAACTQWNPGAIEPGHSTAADLQRHLGQPDYEWRNAAGQRVIQFTSLPNGQETWAATLDANGVVGEWRQLLTPENFQRVARGMSQDEVQQLLGRPISKQAYSLKQQVVWDWPFHVGGQEMRFHVHFGADGKVAKTSSMPLQSGG